MKKLCLALAIIIPIFLHAQPGRTGKPDSLAIYQQQLRTLQSAALDSLRNSEEYKTAMQNYERLSKRAVGYAGIIIFLDAIHSDYRQFNQSLAQMGFPPLDETTLRIGFGSSFKTNRTIIDFYYVNMGIKSKSEKGDEKITAGVSNFLQLDIGYNLLTSRWFSIYPYGGVSLRTSDIRYKKTETQNPNYTSIIDMLSGGEDIKLSSTRVGYQLGMGFDLPISRFKDNAMVPLLFIKAGISGPMWKYKYQHGDLPAYDTGIKQGVYNISFGFKLVG